MPRKSLMHHDIQKIISYHNFYSFFPLCKREEFKLFQLLESFKKNVLMHHPSIKKSMTYINLHWIKNYDINTIFFIAIFFQWCKIFVWKWCDLAYLTRNTLTRCLYDLPPLAGILAQFTFSMVWKFTKSQFFWPPTPLLLQM